MSDEKIHITVDSVVTETATDAPARPEMRDGELTCPCGDVLVEGASSWVAGQRELYCCTCRSRFELGTLRELHAPQSAPAVDGDAGGSAEPTPVRLDQEKLIHLRVAAGAAGGERWEAHEDGGSAWVTLYGYGENVACEVAPDVYLLPARARHIAEADPATVLALLDRIEDLERMAEHVEWYADRLRSLSTPLNTVRERALEYANELLPACDRRVDGEAGEVVVAEGVVGPMAGKAGG
jgi:hypothetical protein